MKVVVTVHLRTELDTEPWKCRACTKMLDKGLEAIAVVPANSVLVSWPA